MATLPHDIPELGSSVLEIKEVRYWGLITNEILKMLKLRQKVKWLGLGWFCLAMSLCYHNASPP